MQLLGECADDNTTTTVGNRTYRLPKHYSSIVERWGTIKAMNTKTDQEVSIEKVEDVIGNYRLQKRNLRVVKLQSYYRCEYILKVRGVHLAENDFYIITDCMETTLHHVIASRQALTDDHFKYFIYQMLLAVHYVHSSRTVILNLCPRNVLINSDCSIKIHNFGQARCIDSARRVHSKDVRYEAPEIIIGNIALYQSDVWSIGCILAELMQRRCLFEGRTSVNQVSAIIDMLGKPHKEDIEIFKNPVAARFIDNLREKPKVELKERIPNATPMAIDLLSGMLVFNPYKRFSIKQCLEHPYFSDIFDISDLEVTDPVDWTSEEQDRTIQDVERELTELLGRLRA
mmetsp:Transcript_4843/g.9053  ORF Transcript_4843/g.9053 Transcript_4843/m.9053 type:complete len:343 (-) Transcript_4843:549-1577(-)